jgi:hypothetical protein
MDAVLDYLVARLQEPSTWVSLGTLATAIGWNLAPDHWQLIALIGMGVGSTLGAIIRERRKTTPAEIKAVIVKTVEPEAIK